MRYILGFREGAAAAALSKLLATEVDPARQYHLMEFCGGHTHAIFHYGVEDLLPANVQLVHGRASRAEAGCRHRTRGTTRGHPGQLWGHVESAGIPAAKSAQGARAGGGCAHGLFRIRGAGNRGFSPRSRGGLFRDRL